MKKLIIGTKVFDIRYGWGKVTANSSGILGYEIIFSSDTKTNIETYSIEGKLKYDKTSMLSLTEYSLEKGGFIPIDAELPLQVGEMAYFWDTEYDKVLGYSCLKGIGNDFYICQDDCVYPKASREIPEWFLDKFNT